jgi:DNA-binding transcriptional LysR family regulator
MELRQLRQFVTVAETLSFRRAAERLCMAQPPLSVAIRKLEEEIGVALFDRASRGVQLTAAGHAAYEVARKCLRDAEELASAARAAADGESGRLRIGFVGSVTFGLMPRFVRAFSERYPNVKLELSEATNAEAVLAVDGGALDIAFVRVPTMRPLTVKFQHIESDVFCIALPACHPLASRKSLRLMDLAEEPFVGYAPSRAGGLHAAVTHLLQRAGVSPTVAQEGVQVQTLIGLVESGLGLALVPAVSAAHAPAGVAFRPIRDLPRDAVIGIALAYHLTDESVVAHRFRDLVAEENRATGGAGAGPR